MLLPLQQPGALYLRLPVGEGIQNGLTFKLKGGMVPKKGAQAPQGMVTMPKAPQDGMPKA